ncbi:antibiotic biosynthesis monooxygenase [Bradyrhizobium sp. BRP14]|nr:antibiotic biosynthesis monooxygenase [Bradyrhizobium sp. BRP14]
MTKLTNIAFIRAQAGKGDLLGDWLNKLATPSRDEAGCINYDVHRSLDDPDLWFVYENWRSKADLEAHFEMPHMTEFVTAIPSLLDGPLYLRHLTMTTEPAHAPS